MQTREYALKGAYVDATINSDDIAAAYALKWLQKSCATQVPLVNISLAKLRDVMELLCALLRWIFNYLCIIAPSSSVKLAFPFVPCSPIFSEDAWLHQRSARSAPMEQAYQNGWRYPFISHRNTID